MLDVNPCQCVDWINKVTVTNHDKPTFSQHGDSSQTWTQEDKRKTGSVCSSAGKLEALNEFVSRPHRAAYLLAGLLSRLLGCLVAFLTYSI